jgi:hypothetical protein
VFDAEAAGPMITALSTWENTVLCAIDGCSMDPVLKSLLSRNQRLKRSVFHATITFLCCRKYYAQECGLLGVIAPQVVQIIAKYLFATRGDPVWLKRGPSEL